MGKTETVDRRACLCGWRLPTVVTADPSRAIAIACPCCGETYAYGVSEADQKRALDQLAKVLEAERQGAPS